MSNTNSATSNDLMSGKSSDAKSFYESFSETANLNLANDDVKTVNTSSANDSVSGPFDVRLFSGPARLHLLDLLSAEDFVKAVQSPGGSRDIDEIFNLPDDEYYEYVAKSLCEPARTEVDTVLVHGPDKYEKYGKFYDAFISDGLYYSNINLIKINYYRAANDAPETRRIAEQRNSKIKSAWFHEDDHRRVHEYLLKVVATLNFEQICEVAVHKEIVARLASNILCSGEKSANMIMEKILDDANKIFYFYIRDKQFVTDVGYMVDIANSQLNMLEQRGLADKYPQISHNQIIKDIYTVNGESLLDKVLMKTRVRLNEFVAEVMDFDELARDLSRLKKSKKLEILNIKTKQKILFTKNVGKSAAMTAERGNVR
ncbi:MAG: hypothetical protein LBJ73_01595 [Rickettsiales bacterium]|nr:hypothetical protein [Rickettsiales bacterium]